MTKKMDIIKTEELSLFKFISRKAIATYLLILILTSFFFLNCSTHQDNIIGTWTRIENDSLIVFLVLSIDSTYSIFKDSITTVNHGQGPQGWTTKFSTNKTMDPKWFDLAFFDSNGQEKYRAKGIYEIYGDSILKIFSDQQTNGQVRPNSFDEKKTMTFVKQNINRNQTSL